MMKNSMKALLTVLYFSSSVLGAACRIKSKEVESWFSDQHVPSTSSADSTYANWRSSGLGYSKEVSWSTGSWTIPSHGHSGGSWIPPVASQSSLTSGHSSLSLPIAKPTPSVWPSSEHAHSFPASRQYSSHPIHSKSSLLHPSSISASIPVESSSSSSSFVTFSGTLSSPAPSRPATSLLSSSVNGLTSSAPLSSIPSASLSISSSSSGTSSAPPVLSTSCNGETYVYNELAGYGVLAGDSRDSLRDTLGGFGSAIAIDRNSWTKNGNSYTFILYGLPDRGWNTEGTLNYQSRIHKFQMTFTPAPGATVDNPSGPNLIFEYVDTLLLTGPDGVPTTGLNADQDDYENIDGFPILPVATYTGDGFGGSGSGGRRISVDAEGLFLGADGTFWISDEYGPYIYQFDSSGKMLQAIQPPDAILPLRNGSVCFATDDVFIFNQNATITPEDPTQGREDNQGFEGFTVDPSGTHLWALLQSAASQEGGEHKADRRYTRLVQYDISGLPELVGEWVIPLPLYTDAGSTLVAAQSDIHYISDTQFLILSRDKSHGHGQDDSTSIYRHIDVFDISAATNVMGTYDAFNASVATSKGVLNADITPAQYCSFLDFNNNTQLNRFGVHNGGDQDSTLLNEKWESLALMPAEAENEYYLFSLSDDDFITQNGFMNFGQFPYADASGFNLDNQALVFRVTLPSGSSPLIS